MDRVRLVVDNLNIHTLAALYETFAPAEARLPNLGFFGSSTGNHFSMPNDLKLYNAATLGALSSEAVRSPRRRKNLNVHPVLEDPVQRLFNALEPGTYARPHRHARDNGWELMVVVRGAFAVLRFDDAGRVLARADLCTDDGDCAVEIPAYAWHCAVSLAPGTIMFEVKPGSYSPIEDKDFAVWAPPEGDPRAPEWVRWFETAKPGDRAPGSSDLP